MQGPASHCILAGFLMGGGQRNASAACKVCTSPQGWLCGQLTLTGGSTSKKQNRNSQGSEYCEVTGGEIHSLAHPVSLTLSEFSFLCILGGFPHEPIPVLLLSRINRIIQFFRYFIQSLLQMRNLKPPQVLLVPIIKEHNAYKMCTVVLCFSASPQHFNVT